MRAQEKALRSAIAKEMRVLLDLPRDTPEHIILDTTSAQFMLLEANIARLIVALSDALPLGPLRRFLKPSSDTIKVARLYLNDT